MRSVIAITLGLAILCSTPLAAQEALSRSLPPENGTIQIPAARVSLELGDRYDFYGPEDARTIIVEHWDNRPEQAEGVLGVILPAGLDPREDGWGGIVTYAETGWISNDDARSADYDIILEEMQANARAENLERSGLGYPELEIVGWAQQPTYDSVRHALIWAREFDFSDTENNSLSYDVRLLGREGVLSINFVADMDKLPAIRRAASEITDGARFDPGARYEDYEAGSDEAAGYGLAGLVASGAGLAVAKQFGLLAMLAKLAKPLLVGLGIALALFFVPIRRWLRRRKSGDRD
ncbi:DUF2167 domain-containing protein [Aurantiacibacter sediminis]|uniref:DUF2167 domain-containing protein n=1 Tax=Aurantiacibacter sediminis TaxID=2793064 RepID=A0ABS0N3X7_9SPHN|nr:DUF2167 domain-containing protein [Aurantiacibacter sediminis]MBH5322673.1 DUF2167 domain-containing protein [Aurantiacibacter sediminis]